MNSFNPRLKILYSQGCAGSIPVLGTLIIKELRSFVAPFFFPAFLLALKIALFHFYSRTDVLTNVGLLQLE